jgi:hypothetical protein
MTIDLIAEHVPTSRGMSGHHSARMGKDEWLTPPELLARLGQFDLDPCSPIKRPWDTAAKHYTIEDNGLSKPWEGRVWMNPPYGSGCAVWLRRLADHGDGLALIPARTETEMFFDSVWSRADALLFLRGRLHFHHVGGHRAAGNSGAPSVLIAYGAANVKCLKRVATLGAFVPLRAAGDRQGDLFRQS